ncbi:hypothetical protein U9M48_030248 [Paspalum notatum var. saurae]|uniref:Uncharacterized protein n=1 Tax=Paspalum notatum var. saurae TaxID=547442 RepID=A0AAQ3X2F1_PASNO
MSVFKLKVKQGLLDCKYYRRPLRRNTWVRWRPLVLRLLAKSPTRRTILLDRIISKMKLNY